MQWPSQSLLTVSLIKILDWTMHNEILVFHFYHTLAPFYTMHILDKILKTEKQSSFNPFSNLMFLKTILERIGTVPLITHV